MAADAADPFVDHGVGPAGGVHSGSSGGHRADTLAFVTIRVGLAALCVVAALAGCTEEAAPAPLPSVPTASPTPAALPVPPEATPESAEGAAAFARYYMAVLTKAFQDADATQLRTLSDGACGGCNNFIGAVEGSAEANERTEGGEFNVVFAESPPVEDGDVIVELRYSRAAARIVTGDGTVRVELPPDPPLDAQMRLVRKDAGWVVMGLRASPQ